MENWKIDANEKKNNKRKQEIIGNYIIMRTCFLICINENGKIKDVCKELKEYVKEIKLQKIWLLKVTKSTIE